MSDVSNGIFSDHCYNQMWELFKTPEDEVGSNYKGTKRGRSITNCIIYVSNVLIYAHEKIGRSSRNERINQIGRKEQDGTKLAKYLVEEIGWKAHYWNPDVEEPRDKKDEHPFSYNQALKRKTYYDIHLSGLIINYYKTSYLWTKIPVPMIPLQIPVPVDPSETKILEKLSKVKFAFGIARGGRHTFLVSYGEVFEVHYEEEGAKLYGKVAFKNYDWLSGVLVVPPDSTFTSNEVKAK